MNPVRRCKPISVMVNRFTRAFFYFVVMVCFVVCCALPLHAGHAGVQGQVTSVEKGYIRMDIGSADGLRVGDTGQVYYMVLVGKERDFRSIYVARFRVTRTFRNAAIAKVEETRGEIMVGHLVQMTGEPITTQKKQPPAKVAKRAKGVKSGLQAGQIWRDPHLRMSFVWVPGGCFEMGCGDWTSDCSDNEKPVHKVCLSGFWMARHEVTQRQWQRLMGYNPSDFKRCGSQCPVESVSWNEALEFARKLSTKTGYTFRLPTEAEWEYACRSGGKKQQYAGGQSLSAAAWYRSNAGGGPHPVGRKRPNGLGIYDMSGNVWEWCLDISDKKAYHKAKGTLRNPVFINTKYANIYGEGYYRMLSILKEASGYRIVRGGSWGNVAHRLRCSARIRGKPGSRRDWLGFRLVRELKRK